MDKKNINLAAKDRGASSPTVGSGLDSGIGSALGSAPGSGKGPGIGSGADSAADIAELLHLKRTFYTLLAHTPDYIYIKDAQHRFVFASNAFARFVKHRSWTELVGKTDFDVFPREHAEVYFEGEREVIGSGMELVNAEEPYLDTRGALRWVSTSKRPIFDDHGAVVGLFGISRDITEVKAAGERIEKLGSHVPGVIYEFQRWPDGRACLPFATAGIQEIYGVTPEQVKTDATSLFSVIDAQDVADVRESILRSAAKLETWRSTHWVNLPGKRICVEGEATPELQADGSVLWHGYIRDVSALVEARHALKRAEEQSRLLLEYSYEGIFGVDMEGVTTFANAAALKMLGYEEGEFIGVKNHAQIHHSRRDGTPTDLDDRRQGSASRTGAPVRVENEVFWRKDGTCFPVDYRSSPILRGKEIVGSVVTFHDISVFEDQKARIADLACHDMLTGLPNRNSFQKHLAEEVARYNRYGGSFALLLINLDNFKALNDTRGHALGDEVLKLIAARIRDYTRESDYVARVGGDEFVVLMPRVRAESEPVMLGQQLIEAIEEPLMVDEREITVSATIGAWCADGASVTDQHALSKCDIALYRAKESGRGRCLLFQDGMSDRVLFEAEVAYQLSRAAANDELRLVLQPVVSVTDQKHQGFEALLRWRSSKLGDVSPGEFIPIAEKRGLIKPLGAWVVERLCQLVLYFDSRGVNLGRIAFNLSRLQMRDGEHLAELFSTFSSSGIDPRRFLVEVTETAFTEGEDAFNSNVFLLQRAGLGLSIDDFGTGYSSLVDLREFRAGHLKIDQQFIRDMLTDEEDGVIVRATVGLAHALNMRVVAEGVETAEQFQALREVGCDSAQGYFISRPLEVDELLAYVRRSKEEIVPLED